MKHIFKIIILFLILLLISIIYTVGLLNNTQNQIDNLIDNVQSQVYDIKTNFESIYKELEDCKNDLSDVNYDKEIEDIYNKINNLYETIESYNANLNNKDTEHIENTKDIEGIKEPSTDNIDKNNTDKKEPDNNEHIYEDMAHLYYGRLYVPSLNINVALYYGWEQFITDRIDSANIFFFGDDDGYTIADHNDQEFAKLLGIKVGTQGYIQQKYLGRINIKCVDVFMGYNNGQLIVDENGINAMNRTDYMMYTCYSDSTHVLICLWDIV